jgi:hypothetical protein
VALNTITPKPYNHIDHERIGISNIYSLLEEIEDRYQRGKKNLYIEEDQKTQLPK